MGGIFQNSPKAGVPNKKDHRLFDDGPAYGTSLSVFSKQFPYL